MTQNFNFALVSGAAILLAACGGNNTQTAAPVNPVRNPQYVTTTVLDTTRIAGGSGHALGLTSDGNTVYAWGYNGAGQLGNGLTAHSNTPIVITGLSGIQAVRGGGYHSLALTNASNGEVYAWGDNTFGQLGNGSLGTGLTKRPTLVAAIVGGLSQVRVIGAGQTHSVALASNGTIWGWGKTPTASNAQPARLTGVPTSIKTVVAGWNHDMALTTGNTIYAWGTNTSDQLGTGNHTVTNTPALVPGMSNVRAIAAGAVHSIAVTTSGTVYAWGTNSYGQLGIASAVVPTPKVVPGISTAVAVAAGPYNSAVLLADGTVRAWGYNAWGQLGTGNFTNAKTPQVVTGASNIVQISFANGFLLLLASNGTVYTVGLNNYGQLGNHANTNSNVLLQPTGVGGSGTLTLP